MYSMMNSPNNVVGHIAKIICSDATSPLGRNIAFLRHKYCVDIGNSAVSNAELIEGAHVISSEQQSLLTVVREMRGCTIDQFSTDMRNDILFYVCVN